MIINTIIIIICSDLVMDYAEKIGVRGRKAGLLLGLKDGYTT